MLNLSSLEPKAGARQSTKRLGRGESSGLGKTSGKGHKGQSARSGGGKTPVGFEGGQMPLHRRSPKWGFNQHNRTRYQAVNLSLVEKNFENNANVDVESLYQKGLIRNLETPVKILANGDLKKSFNFSVHAVSSEAVKKIEASKSKLSLIKIKVYEGRSKKKVSKK